MINDISKQNVIKLYNKARYDMNKSIKKAKVPEGHLKFIILAKIYKQFKSITK